MMMCESTARASHSYITAGTSIPPRFTISLGTQIVTQDNLMMDNRAVGNNQYQ